MSVAIGNQSEAFRVVFEAARGSGSAGYTALDDVMVVEMEAGARMTSCSSATELFDLQMNYLPC